MVKENKGLILKADYGFDLAYNQSPSECVLIITIYTFDDDMFSTLYFKQDKVSQLLRELHNDYAPDSLEQLVHTFVEVLPGKNELEIPRGIRADYRMATNPEHPFVMCDNRSFWEE